MALDEQDRVYAPGEDRQACCVWFAACTRPANGLREHPVLGPVPICKRCDDKIERLSELTSPRPVRSRTKQ